jgi:hypothetical protein
MPYTFDDLEEVPIHKESPKPFHKVKDGTEKQIHDWLKKTVTGLQKQGVKRHHLQRSNLGAYRGIQPGHYLDRSNTTRNRERVPINRTDRLIINHLFDITETKVSQLMRIKPSVDVLPKNDEFEDKNAAKSVEMLLQHLKDINNIDYLVQEVSRYAKIFGEAYLMITWDENKGDVHPEYKPGMLLLDEAGQPVMNEKGEAEVIGKPVKIGDVKFEVELPWRIYLQRKKRYCDVEYAFRVKIRHMEDVKADYPEKKELIQPDHDNIMFDMSSFEEHRLEDEVVEFEFFHPPSKYVPEGRYIKFVKNGILESKDYPYEHGRFPWRRRTDIDIPDVLNGVSFYEHIAQIQNMHTNVTTMIAKNIYLTGHAKWVMPRGAAKIESLGNDNTIVQYQGPVAPQLLTTQPSPPEAYQFRNDLVNDMQQISAVHGVSRGEPPKGVTAAVAMQFLNEQEAERGSTDIAKHSDFVVGIFKDAAAVCGQYYQADDGRMLQILGKDNQYMFKYFDAANLSKPYDIRMKLGNELAETKAMKIERVFQAMQYNREMLSPERWADLLELGNTDKMQTLITEAIRAADSENEDLMEGKDVAPPQEWEDHILHWRTHVKLIQKRSFKEEVPLEIRETMINHIKTHEFAMMEKAKKSALFEAKLAELKLFPLFYEDMVPQSREQKEALVQGQSNRGEPVSTEMAAQEPAQFEDEPQRRE